MTTKKNQYHKYFKVVVFLIIAIAAYLFVQYYQTSKNEEKYKDYEKVERPKNGELTF